MQTNRRSGQDRRAGMVNVELNDTGTHKSLNVAHELLKVAKCPNNCVDGYVQLEAVQDRPDSEPYYPVEPCQWCGMRDEILRA